VTIFLSISIPMVYVTIGAYVGTRIYDSLPEANCRAAGGHTRFTYSHGASCCCIVPAMMGGMFWPLASPFYYGMYRARLHVKRRVVENERVESC
jgi:hypothetical protein